MKASSSIVALALLGAVAQAVVEEKIGMENEELIVDSLRQYASDEKFISFTHHLGTPAMHPQLQDGKL
jgi:hypothetical protein